MSTSWREQLAWAAGFYDGEGCCTFTNKTGAYKVTISQNDPEVLLKFQQSVLGVGRVLGPYKTASMGNSKPRWAYVAAGSSAQAVIAMLWPWLGTLKREQATRHLSRGTFARPVWRGEIEEPNRLCRAGHTWAGNRTKHGQCRACMRESDRRRRAAKSMP